MTGALDWLDRRGVKRGDLAIAAGFVVLSQVQIWTVGAYDAPIVVALGALVVAVAIALRRRAPVLAAIVIAAYFVGAFVAGLANTPDNPSFPGASLLLDPDVTLLPAATVLLASYSAAAHSERRRSVAVAAIMIAILTALTIAEGIALQELIVAAIGIGIAWLIGRRMRRRRWLTAALADRAAALERNQEERARVATAEERARIARELHDIVAHSLSVIVLQAAAEQRVVPPELESTHGALETIEGTGRQALTELRRLLGMLRTEDATLDLAPLPSMRNVEDLVEQVRAAGLTVELQLDGEPAALAPGVDLSAYRIVQEALTNALKHAGPARARVSVRYGDTYLELEIVDNGRGARNGGGPGHGLVGMRERAELFGGDLDAGDSPDGGFAVRARFPLEPAA